MRYNIKTKFHGDRWSDMGAEHLGENNIRWAQVAGPLTLMKAIMNDYWADAQTPGDGWSQEKVDMVMSKLYWCWVCWLNNEEGVGPA